MPIDIRYSLIIYTCNQISADTESVSVCVTGNLIT